MVEGLTVEDIWKGDVKGVKVNGARNIGQGHPVKVPAERTLRRSTAQGLMVVGLIVEEKLNVNVKCVKGTGAQNIKYSSGGFSKSPRAGGEWIRVERIKF